jgi:hypothetical protein
VCVFTWLTKDDPFFWDTVQLGSKHAHFFFQSGLRWLPLPTAIDSGHPPIFGYYLAMVWVIFGKTLVASHVAMLPFLLLIGLFLLKIGGRLVGPEAAPWLLFLVFFDPVMLGQSAMISPDIVLAAFFLMALEGMWGRHKWMVVLGVLGLCAISMRGMMTAAALFGWSVLLPLLRKNSFRSVLVTGLLFLPGFIFSTWFLAWHFKTTGWVGHHQGSPWAAAFRLVSIPGFLRNIAIVGWRWADFGRVGELLFLMWALYGLKWRQFKDDKSAFSPLFSITSLLVFLLVFFVPSALWHQNLSAHRYFLPAFFVTHLLVLLLVLRIKSVSLGRKWLLSGLVFCLGLGNFWIYPTGISMDWDSTLAHRPYHGLRSEALRFLTEKNIDFKEVGTEFPNINTGEDVLLNGDDRQFSPKDFELNQYIMASNIYNDFSESDVQRLQNGWLLIWSSAKSGVWIRIYARK